MAAYMVADGFAIIIILSIATIALKKDSHCTGCILTILRLEKALPTFESRMMWLF